MRNNEQPQDLPELLTDLAARVRALELRGALSLGPWVLEVRAGDGALVATHAGTGAVTVVASP